MKTVDFDNLIDSEASLYLCTDVNCFQLGSVIFEVVEDESDGYRSAMSEVVIKKMGAAIMDCLDTVKITKDGEDIFVLKSVITDHEWLRFGTDYSDSYYPCFIFSWESFDPEGFYETLKDKIK